jgi:hypothetical protein
MISFKRGCWQINNNSHGSSLTVVLVLDIRLYLQADFFYHRIWGLPDSLFIPTLRF